jgi:hypothetical protein
VKVVLKYPLLVGIVPSIAINSFASRGMMTVAGQQLWMGPLKFKQEQMLIPHLVRMGVGIPANLVAAFVIPRIGVWRAIFWGYSAHIVIGILADMWPIWCMNHYDCWGSTLCGACVLPILMVSRLASRCCGHVLSVNNLPARCVWLLSAIYCPTGDGSWGTDLFWAKWVGTITKEVIRPFVDAIYGPAQFAMISMQVAQTEQASIQSAFNLVGGITGIYAPIFFYDHCFNTSWRSWRVITYAFVGYGLHAVATVLFFCAYMLDRYLIYHNSTRVITNPRFKRHTVGFDATHGVDDYRRDQNQFSGDNFDYRREFNARAEQNYRRAGIYGNGSRGSNGTLGVRQVRDLGTGAAARSRDATHQQQQQQSQQGEIYQPSKSKRQSSRGSRMREQRRPLLSQVRGTTDNDL